MVAQASRYRLPLLGSLLIAVGLELVLHRACLQFLKPRVLEPESDLFRLFNGGVGPLFFYFSSFLALAACGWILVLVVREDGVFSLPWRVVIGLFSCVFLPVCAVGAFVSHAGLRPLSHSLRELHPYLNIFFAPMVAALVAALVARPGSMLAKAGALMYVIPLLGFAYFSYRTASWLGEAPAGVSLFERLRPVSAVPQGLRTFFLYSGPVAFLAFIPLSCQTDAKELGPGAAVSLSAWRAYAQALLEPGPMVAGLSVGLLVGVGIKLGFEPLRVAVDAALAFDLPPPSGGALLALGSLSLLSWTVASLAWRPGPTRTVALGLIALSVAGMRLSEPLYSLQLPEPLYYLLAVVGLLALCVGIVGASDRTEQRLLRERSPVIPDERWLGFLGISEAALVGEVGQEAAIRRLVEQEVEVTGFEGRYQGLPLSLYARRVEGRLESLSLVLGEALGQAADFSATPRQARWWRKARPPEPLVVRDRAAMSDRLLDDDLRARLRDLPGGTLEVWSNVGLRYRFRVQSAQSLGNLVPVVKLADPGMALPSPSGLLALCELLAGLALRAGVNPRSETAASTVPA